MHEAPLLPFAVIKEFSCQLFSVHFWNKFESTLRTHIKTSSTSVAEELHGRRYDILSGRNSFFTVCCIEGKHCFRADLKTSSAVEGIGTLLVTPFNIVVILHCYHQSFNAGNDSRSRRSIAFSRHVSAHKPQP